MPRSCKTVWTRGKRHPNTPQVISSKNVTFCPSCNKELSSKDNLRRHCKRVCGAGSQVQCNVCEKTFKCDAYLKAHIRLKHLASLGNEGSNTASISNEGSNTASISNEGSNTASISNEGSNTASIPSIRAET
ncbi:unnamed protein product, partial [Meganyctiphanes norvegica]